MLSMFLFVILSSGAPLERPKDPSEDEATCKQWRCPAEPPVGPGGPCVCLKRNVGTKEQR